jgi:hypothetical protein
VRKIGKTELTKQLEKKIWDETNKLGIFGCFEVTIGWAGDERVDYMTYDTKGIWRCYEIKVSKADFHSKAKKTFIGNYNYYVMPKELYEEVKEEIPRHIGVYCENWLVKRPKKQPLGVDEQVLKDSMIRSLSRENEKFIKTCDTSLVNRLKNKIDNLEKEKQEHQRYKNKMYYAITDICSKYNLKYEEVRELVRQNI